MRYSKRIMAANSLQIDPQMQDTAFAHLPTQYAMKRILLVDNQAHVLRVMKLTLDRNGYEVDTALSADVALGKLRENEYDVLITDSHLEKLDGQQLISTIAEQFCDRAPAMFLVADHHAEDLDQWSSQIKRTECLEKPISLRYLVGRLNELFGKFDDM